MKKKVFILYGNCKMSAILRYLSPPFCVSYVRVSVAKGSARLVDSAVFPEYWVQCMQPDIQAKTLQK